MRAAFEKRFHFLVGPKSEVPNPKPSQELIDAEADKVVKAYQEVLGRFPHTEIAADCASRLSGFYQFQGEFDKAVELMKNTAEEFAGTKEGIRAIFEMAFFYLQARHDPAEATKWFSRIPKPTKPAGSPYDRDDVLYLSAQEGFAKCELALRQDLQARQRIDDLKQAYPQFKDEIERSYQFEVESCNGLRASAVRSDLHAAASVVIVLGRRQADARALPFPRKPW